ncbi:MAG: methionyl-tRNA formyltransferase [Clostridia bacterium]|nr:methionyl-tRNA formyltransferase [Clostridia bacterium]
MKVIYLGTPAFAVKPLEAILNSPNEVAAVITQPDKPNARGNKALPCAVKAYAVEKGLRVLQFGRIRDAAAVDTIRSLNADIMVTCAYGQILSQEILELTRYGVINIHASLLPKYRGSSPVQWALINGEKEVGVTIMQTAYEVDSGDIILQESISLDGNENAEETLNKLSPLGARLIVKALDLIESGKAVFLPQEKDNVTHFPMLKKADGKMDFNKTAIELKNFIRGMNPWPGAYTQTKYGILKIKSAEVVEGKSGAVSGEVILSNPKQGFVIQCAEGAISLLCVQGENAKEMSFADFLRGKPIDTGTAL